MGTHGIRASLRTVRIAALMLLCITVPALLWRGGERHALNAQGEGSFRLTYELLTDEEGNITGIVIRGRNAPEKFRGKRKGLWVTLYYSGNGDDFIPTAARGKTINPDGTFEVKFNFTGEILNKGVWRATVEMPKRDPEIEDVLDNILVDSANGKKDQYAIVSRWRIERLKVFEETRDEFLAHAETLKSAGLVGKKFKKNRDDLKPELRELLAFLHGKKVRRETGDAFNKELGLKHVEFQTARSDLAALGVNLKASRRPPYFLPYEKSNDEIEARLTVVAPQGYADFFAEIGAAFNGIYPKAVVDVSRGTDSVALKRLMDGKTDIAVTTRPLTTSEALLFTNKWGYAPCAVRLGRAGAVAIIVNRANPIKALSPAQIDAIFSKTHLAGYGEDITTWDQLGVEAKPWKDGAISIVVPPANSPSVTVLRNVVMEGGDMKDRLNEQPDPVAVIRRVLRDPLAIGLCPVERFRSVLSLVRVVPVLTRNGPVAPATAAFKQGKYPLTSYAYMYLSVSPGWDEWKCERLNRIIHAERLFENKRPKLVLDTTSYLEEHFKSMRPLLSELARQVELNLMSIEGVAEMFIQEEINRRMADGEATGKTPEEIRKEIEAETVKKYGSLENAMDVLRKHLASSLQNAQKAFDGKASFIRAKLALEEDVTVVDLYRDLVRIYDYYWDLCDAYQAALKEFNPSGWQVIWLDRVTALKDTAQKYVPGHAHNISTRHGKSEIDKKMKAIFDELPQLRQVFLKELYAKHKTPKDAREEIPNDIDGVDPARALQKAYDALRDVVNSEVGANTPPLKKAIALVDGRHSAIREYMAPFMPGALDRRKPRQKEIDRWLAENFYSRLKEERQKCVETNYERYRGRGFRELFPNFLKLYPAVLGKVTYLGELYRNVVFLDDKTPELRKKRDRELQRLENLNDTIEDMLKVMRSMCEEKYDINDKAIHTPDEKGFRERYAEE